MEKVEPPKPPGAKDVDQGGQEGSRSFGTDDIWKNSLKKFQTQNHIADTEMKDIVAAGDLGEADTEVEKATQLFKTWRHPPGPNTKAMVAVAGCLGWVDTAAGFVQDHVSGTVSALSPASNRVLLIQNQLVVRYTRINNNWFNIKDDQGRSKHMPV
jgi:hypothetical protein